MQNKFSEFSEQPNVGGVLLMLGCTTVLGGDLGLGIFEAYDMELPWLFKNSYLPTQQH
jgi:hypothetical protein